MWSSAKPQRTMARTTDTARTHCADHTPDKEPIRQKDPLPSVANTGALTRKEDMTNIEEELKKAKEILDNNPVLEYSPGDLRRIGRTIEEYLSRWPQAEQEKYRDYYEEEL